MREHATVPGHYERAVPGGDRSDVRKRGIAQLARRGELGSALRLLRAQWDERSKGRPSGPLSDMELRERRAEVADVEILEADEAKRKARR